MRQCRFGLATFVLCLLSIAGYAQQNSPDAEIKAAITKLGEGTDENGFAHFETLYKNPRRATELLISSLEPVRRDQYVSGKHPQVVWDIRALRSLTGLDFRATTNSKLDDEEAHFLDRNAKGEVHLFGTWMSRDRVWVAPLDVQTAIITKWREWCEKNCRTFAYVNDRNFDDWYF